MNDPSHVDLVSAEIAELHQYARSLFDFEGKWSAAIWAGNVAACGWLVANAPNQRNEEFALCVVFAIVNGIAVFAMNQAIPRQEDFAARLRELADQLKTATFKPDPAKPVMQLADALRKMRLVSILLIVIWMIFAVLKKSGFDF